MGLFGKKNVFLGIDLGSSVIKIVEITYKGQRPHLTNYAHVVVPQDGTQEEALGAALKEMHPDAHDAYVSLPGSSGLVTLISFPQMSQKDLVQAVSFEARKHIPVPLEQVNISWDVVGHSSGTSDGAVNDENISGAPTKKDGRMHILLVAAPRKDVALYEEYISTASLNLKALELETFSLVRSLVGDDSGRFLIMDIGARATNIILVEKGVIRANRNIGTGGDIITQTIAGAMGVTYERAQKHKHAQDESITRTPAVRGVIDVIVNEAQRVLSSSGNKQVDNVIITGGTAELPGVQQQLAEVLNMQVAHGNPWARITIDDSILPQAKALSGSFAVALGLALRGVEEYRRK